MDLRPLEVGPALLRPRPASVMAGEPMVEIQTVFVASAAVADGTRGPHPKWWLVGWMAALATCIGASLLWTPTESSATPASVPGTVGLSQAPGELVQPRASSRSTDAATNHGRSIVVILPTEDDYVSAQTIAVAGLATGRPHGPKVHTVHAELKVNGRVVGRADLPVYSGRFAGILEITVGTQAGSAELRVVDPARPRKPSAVRRFILAASRHGA